VLLSENGDTADFNVPSDDNDRSDS